MAWFIGVDVGGTFTDFYAFDTTTSRSVVFKTASTPQDPAQAILEGLDTLCGREAIDKATVTRLAHGTTVATNTLIQRQGAKLALVTTQGFRDLLEIGRQTRPLMFDLKADHPPPLVPRERRFEIAERVGPRGEVILELTEQAIAEVVEKVRAAEVDACAVGLLFAFLHPDHERRIGAALSEAMPELFVALSSEVQPEFREYERFSTTTLNAYLQPLVGHYMAHLGEALTTRMPAAHVGINQSSGGLMSIERARQIPIRTALSGPAAGVVGAVHLARLSQRPNVVTLDMGGTSADVCLIRDFSAGTAFGRDVAGLPVRLPMLDINTVGAGGGSIAWFDKDGLLKVGPLSAGARPGPACYGLGGDQPTVSDANLVLGRLSPDGLLGGAMALDLDAARAAQQPIAERLQCSLEKAARGVLAIVTANMVRALRAVSVERGYDPRDCALLAFGGAGPLHASDVARSLGIEEILVPPAPGILCAQGLIVSDLKEDFVATVRLPVTEALLPAVQARITRLGEDARNWFATENVPQDQRTLRLSLDMRYVGQNYELTVAVAEAHAGEPLRLPAADRLTTLFFAEHDRSYGHHDPDAPNEVVNIRLTAVGRLPQPAAPEAPAATLARPEPVGQRAVWFDGEAPLPTPVYVRTQLAPGHSLTGPAVVEQLDATTLVYPGDTATVDPVLNLLIQVSP